MNETSKPTPVKAAPKPKKAPEFKDSDYKCMVEYENPRTGKIEEREVLKPEYRKGFGKCRYNCAKTFGVSVDWLVKSYDDLNGKKIDGFYITDIIDRYGFSDGLGVNRVDLSNRYGRTSVRPLEVATKKLEKILQASDVVKEFNKYLSEFKGEKEAELVEEASGL